MRRQVFFIHGFDPRGPAPYHGFAAEAARREGYSITPRRNLGRLSSVWEITGPAGPIRYELLRYDDLVRQLWPRWGGARRYLAAWRVVIGYARSGALGALARHAPPAMQAILLQALITLAPATLILALGLMGWRLAALWIPWPAALGGLAASLAAIPLFRQLEARVSIAWYTRSLAYLMESARGELDDRATRIEEFAARIAEVWRSGTVDEIVVVGHSLGSLLAVETVARVLEMAPELDPRRLVLLTLGQSIPTYGQLTGARDFPGKVADVAARVRWIDVTSRQDSCSSGATPIPGVGAEKIVSLPSDHLDAAASRWSRTFHPLEFHFQYLRPQDPRLGFDYMTAICAPSPMPPMLRIAA